MDLSVPFEPVFRPCAQKGLATSFSLAVALGMFISPPSTLRFLINDTSDLIDKCA